MTTTGKSGETQQRRSVSEDVANRVRRLIRDEGLRPGDRIGREVDLARRFGVSRPTMREALRTLSSTHLIRATQGPGGGIFVDATAEEGIGRSVSAAVASMLKSEEFDIAELLETRLLIEVPLAGLAAQRAGPADVTKLRELLVEAAREPENREHVLAVDKQIHQAVATIAQNRLAAALAQWIVEALLQPLHDLIDPALVEPVIIEQHRDLLRAIERGEPAEAERAMREHLTYLRDLVDAVRPPDRAAPIWPGPAEA